MGTVHCYASYVKAKDDIALSAMSSGWMNEFVEVVIGSFILIPIGVAYLGLDGLKEMVNLGALSLGFKTLPYLFMQWGDIFGAISSFLFFSLLFFAGITSSLAMGTPWIGFLKDEFNWKHKPAAWSFGLIILLLALPTIFFFKYGVFDEYDYWAGTVSLVVFALLESILFAWGFGITRGWQEITANAEIKVPNIYKYIIKFVTPVLLLWVFIGSLVTPKDGNWEAAFQGDWTLDDSSIIKTLMNSKIKDKLANATDPDTIAFLEDQLFYVNASRLLLLSVFISFALLVYIAYKRRIKNNQS
jgi:SNF family Na+-dependent transporter